MKKRFLILLFTSAAIVSGVLFFIKSANNRLTNNDTAAKANDDSAEEVKDAARYTELRAKYEFDMVKDPATGKIPYGILEEEKAFAKKLPVKDGNISARIGALNNYLPAGPNNIGGRTRALAYDVRYNGSSNLVIIAGSVSGGIFKTADGGANWARVSPADEIHNVTSVAQDPRPGFQDTWYAGGGEVWGNSANENGAGYNGFGIYKSTNNGNSWSRLPLNTITDINGAVLGAGTLEAFDNPFDFVHKMAVNPVTGHLYVGSHRRLVRSTDGGNTFNVVFGSATGAIAVAGTIDIAISSTGRTVIAVNGGNPDPALRGVWTSANGNANSFTRIAGGAALGVDSVADWRGNSYDNFSNSTTPLPKRIVLAQAASNNNIIYVLYENGLSNTSPDLSPEADLFKLDLTGGSPAWTNLSSNMPNFSGDNAATDPFAIQGAYDLMVAVKPDNPDFVLVGGTSLYRSSNGFSSPLTNTATDWVGGYGNTTLSAGLSIYPNSHPDMHIIAFRPDAPNECLSGNDGGVQRCTNITATNVSWSMTSNYQTLQYYYVGIDPTSGANNFCGGAQDNGTFFRDKTGILGTVANDSNNHRQIRGGDGGAVGISESNAGTQFAFTGVQLGSIRRIRLNSSILGTTITPGGLTANPQDGFGEFITNFRLNPENTEDLYYANFNRLFRTTAASTVSSSGWTELTGVSEAISPANGTNIAIRAIAFSRGPYIAAHSIYIGTTNARIFRLDDPRNAAAGNAPVNISIPGLAAAANIQDIAVNPNNDNEIMAVVSNYGAVGIWWTDNAKAVTPTWRNAEGNLTLPSIRSCVIVVKKDGANNPVTEYYVGTSVGLFSAENIGTTLTGGGSVTWLREGGTVLNLAIIQSMAYRPADNVLVAGTHGNGMYYTFLGTPNFTPNQVTDINPILNDKNFIQAVFPTSSKSLINYRIGNIFSIKNITIQLFNTTGQQLLKSEARYQTGTVDISKPAKGLYFLVITSSDNKYKYIQKIIKE